MMDARGRFVKVSKDEYQRLKAVAEEPEVVEFNSPANSSWSDTQVPEGWKPKSHDAGAGSPVVDGSSKEGSEFGGTPSGGKDGGQERGPRWNPTIDRIQAKARTRSGRFNELEQLVAGGDMEVMENELFLSQSNEYHSLPLLMEALRKSNRPLDSLCKKLSEDLERLEGKRLIDAMEVFTVKMCGAASCSNYAPVMTIIMLISVLNVKEKEGTAGFRLARKLQKVWQEYSSAVTTDELTLWKMNCEQNQITGGLSEDQKTTWGSPGFNRLHTGSEDVSECVDFFFQGMCSNLGYVSVDNMSAADAYADLVIDIAAEESAGIPHSLRQGETEKWGVWIEKFESRLETLDEAVENSADDQYRLNDAKVSAVLKEAMSRISWTATAKLLTEKHLLWKNLSLDEALFRCNEANEVTEIAEANKKVFRRFEKKAPAAQSGGSRETYQKKKTEEKKALEEPVMGAAAEGGTAAKPGDRSKKKFPCRYFEAGRCERGEDCGFLHVPKGHVAPTPKAKSETVQMMQVVIDEGAEAEGGEPENFENISPIGSDESFGEEGSAVKDEARWQVRQMKKFNLRIPEELREKAEAEAELSMIVDDEAQAPKDLKRVSVPPDKEGYAMLGDFVDGSLVIDRESKAALEDSSID